MKMTNIMKNVGLRKLVDFVIVCGYKGQKVREALEEDGRFSDEVLQTNYYLEETTVTTRVERSHDVDCLDGRCFKIEKKRESFGTANDDAPKEVTSSKTASSDIPTPNQPTPNTSLQPNPSHQPTPNTSLQPTPNKGDQPNREEIYNLLCSQFPDLTKHMKGRQKDANSRDVRKLFSQEFGRNHQLCHDMGMLRRLVELGDSVSQVRINGEPAGSGFLLFGNYILTNAHVVLDDTTKNLKKNINVVFTHEYKAKSLLPLPVTVVDWTYLVDKEGYKQDWALLEVCWKLNTLKIIPQPLLKHFGPVTDSGHICIIGHPDGKFKTMDPCVTIPREKCEELLNPDYLFRDIQTYGSCFYEGSSGSPVFDPDLNVVSMHTGGFHYENNEHAVEYSLPLSLIIEEIILKIVTTKKVPVLLKMITCCDIPKEVMTGLKKKVELNLYREFILTNDDMIELAKTSYCIAEQEHLKDFFRNFNPWIPARVF